MTNSTPAPVHECSDSDHFPCSVVNKARRLLPVFVEGCASLTQARDAAARGDDVWEVREPSKRSGLYFLDLDRAEEVAEAYGVRVYDGATGEYV